MVKSVFIVSLTGCKENLFAVYTPCILDTCCSLVYVSLAKRLLWRMSAMLASALPVHILLLLHDILLYYFSSTIYYERILKVSVSCWQGGIGRMPAKARRRKEGKIKSWWPDNRGNVTVLLMVVELAVVFISNAEGLELNWHPLLPDLRSDATILLLSPVVIAVTIT